MTAFIFLSHYLIKKIESLFDTNITYDTKIKQINIDDPLYKIVDTYCSNIVTSDCESWDIYTNEIIIEYNGSPQSKVLVYILSKFFNQNMHIVTLDSKINHMEDFLYQIDFGTIYSLNNKTSKRKFYKSLYSKHNTNLVFRSTTLDDQAIETIDMIINQDINRTTHFHQPFINVSNSTINEFMKKYSLGAINEPISLACISNTNKLVYNNWVDNFHKFTNEYKYMVECLNNSNNIKQIIASILIKKNNGIILLIDKYYPEKIFYNILNEIVKNYNIPQLNKTIKKQLYINPKNFSYLTLEWCIYCIENRIIFLNINTVDDINEQINNFTKLIY